MKKYDFTTTLSILFDRTESQEVRLPSGRIVTDDVPLPPVLLLTLDTVPVALVAVPGGFETLPKEQAAAIIASAQDATEAKRAPKF